MKIRIEEIPVRGDTSLYDLVLTQGEQSIRLGLIVEDATQAVRELVVWLEAYTMDTADIVRTKRGAA